MGRRLIATSAALAALAAGAATAPGASAQSPGPAYRDWNRELPGFPSSTERNRRAECAGGSDRCIDRTIGEMWRRFHTVVPECDHNAVFSLTYLRVTEDVREAVEAGQYPDHDWINGQDAMFARIYFLAYDNWVEGRQALVPPAWRIAFDAARDGKVKGIGDLLLAMNAHINRDFPFILYHAGLVDGEGNSRKPQHDFYNRRLRKLYAPVLAEIAARFDPSTSNYDIPGTELDDETLFSVLVLWRELAWRNAERLARAPNDAARRRVADRIELTAILEAQAIIAGSAFLPLEDRRARDAFCARNGGQRPGYGRGADVARPLAARRTPSRVRAILKCPDGPGPCAGKLAVRLARRGADGRRRIGGRRRFELAAGERRRIAVRLDRRFRGGRGRADRLVVRSLLGPGDAVVRTVGVRSAGRR